MQRFITSDSSLDPRSKGKNSSPTASRLTPPVVEKRQESECSQEGRDEIEITFNIAEKFELLLAKKLQLDHTHSKHLASSQDKSTFIAKESKITQEDTSVDPR